jgi:hypothetical protein
LEPAGVRLKIENSAAGRGSSAPMKTNAKSNPPPTASQAPVIALGICTFRCRR